MTIKDEIRENKLCTAKLTANKLRPKILPWQEKNAGASENKTRPDSECKLMSILFHSNQIKSFDLVQFSCRYHKIYHKHFDSYKLDTSSHFDWCNGYAHSINWPSHTFPSYVSVSENIFCRFVSIFGFWFTYLSLCELIKVSAA